MLDDFPVVIGRKRSSRRCCAVEGFRCTSSGLDLIFRHRQDFTRKTLTLRQDMT